MWQRDTDDSLPTERRGLSPLPVQMGFIQAEYMRLYQQGLAGERDLHKVLEGISLYQNHPYQRCSVKDNVVWQQGSVRILAQDACGDIKKSGAPLLLIPSLINRSYIFDINTETSFRSFLYRKGVDCYLLDWGEPTRDRGMDDMQGVIEQRLVPALKALAQHCGTRLDALGYCMGGTLLAAAAQRAQDVLRRCVFLASPWNFDAGDQSLRKEIRAGMAGALARISQREHLPKDWIQSVFIAVNARRAFKKFSDFADMAQESDRARLFVAVEDWLNDGVDLPAGLAQSCIVDWYDRNLPGRGMWKIGGDIVTPRLLSLSCFVVASHQDVIVPFESAVALAREIPQADLLQTRKGHIGMMTGRGARDEVWSPVLNWLQSC